MILLKTKIPKMLENCKECWVICELPYENKNCVSHIKSEYCYKRHNECPLVEIKEDIV